MQIRLTLAGLVCAAVWGQDVGMGSRSGSSERFEAPYTLDVATPHAKWAKPLPGGPIRLLAVPTVSEGRTVVELAERLSLELTTVSIDPDWDVNKWTMAFGKDYGARAEKGDLKLVYSYLEAELTGPKKFDAILLPLNHGWKSLTPASRAALKRRVEEGCGLVLVHPEGELSPLVPEGDGAEASAWRRTKPHYITRAIPVETFPFGDVESLKYSAAAGAATLVETESGRPVLATRRVGRGRVVALGYRNHGLSWRMPMEARSRFTGPAWEYFYALLTRSIIYAAHREPVSKPNFDNPATIWRVRDSYNRVRASGRGRAPERLSYEPGRFFVERQSGADWDVGAVDVGNPAGISGLRVEPAVIAEGVAVQVRWDGARNATVELVDGFDRVIARGLGDGAVRLVAGRPLTHGGFARVTCEGAVRAQVPVRFAASSREWNDYEVMLP